jgi:hypothetical protein
LIQRAGQTEGLIVTLPLLLNAFCPVIVSAVDADCLGDEIVTVVGVAEIVNVGVGVTVSVTAADVELFLVLT